MVVEKITTEDLVDFMEAEIRGYDDFYRRSALPKGKKQGNIYGWGHPEHDLQRQRDNQAHRHEILRLLNMKLSREQERAA